jgi:hypothetical protein
MKRIFTLVLSVLISYSTFLLVSCKTGTNTTAEKNKSQDGDTLVLEKNVSYKDSRFTSPFKPSHGSHASHCSHSAHASHGSHFSQHK